MRDQKRPRRVVAPSLSTTPWPDCIAINGNHGSPEVKQEISACRGDDLHSQTQPRTTPDDLILWNLDQVLDGQGIGKSVWYEKVRSGEAPQPVKVTGKRVAWVKAEVLAYRRHLISKRAGYLRNNEAPFDAQSADHVRNQIEERS